ncbi:hypothetical protein [Paenarthrobacter nitroguajacolicus]|uniref:hypothetical protein n=1 Tax=Paenarthrobacter nitroguajacolicus TaxID=211146 RepID=UPI0028548507|nr:hypothetical protein [Paenarthrobacter nitroguajacolicus]MDR6639616.1 hypothetical protein [Paenarthrobacter nitroguajacolicus]
MKGDKRIRRWLSVWGTTILAGIGAIAAVGGPFWGNFRTEESERWIAFGVGALGALVALGIPIGEKVKLHRRISRLESEAKTAYVRARADLQYTLNLLLDPLLRKLGRLARTRPGSRERESAAVELKVRALHFLMRVTNPEETGLRATFFRCEGTGQDLRLVADESTGTETREHFDSSTVEGRRALRVVTERLTDWSENIANEPEDRIDKDRHHGYATFASASAYDGVEKIGLVTVDGQKPGDIAKVDQFVVQTVGTIIAISDALRRNKRREPNV